MKTLLVAAGLLVGGSAWADTKLTFYSNDFSVSNSLDLISVSASANQTLELANDNDTFGNYVRQSTQDRTRDVWMDVSSLLSASFADYTDYTIEFDAAFRSGSTNRTGGNSLTLKSTGSTDIFKMATPSTQVNAGDLVFTVTGADAEKTITLNALKWYHFKFDISATSTTASVTYTVTVSSDNSAVTNGTGTLTITDSRIKQIYFGTARNYGQSRFDNIDIYTMVSGDVANDPTIEMTGVKGENREYTISFGDGETLHYTVPGGTEQTATTSPLVTTITEAGTLSAYTTKGSATSNTTQATVTHGAITLNAPVFTVIGLIEAEDGFFYPQVSFSSDNSSLEGSPTATFDVTSPYTFTAKGDITVTASAEGYTSNSATYTASKKYQLSKTIDFGALTATNFDETIWETATGSPRDYWTNRAAAIPADVTYYKFINESITPNDETDLVHKSAIEGVTLTNCYQRTAHVYIGYGLLSPYDVPKVDNVAYSGNASNNLNIKVNDANSMDYAIYNGWNNYGSGTFNTIQKGDATFALYRYDTMLRTIKLYSGDYSFGIVGDLTGGWDVDAVMTQSTENKNVYTLVVDKFTATAGSTYYYKLRTDGQWGGYELPSSGNSDYYFKNGGVYKLTFTANIKANTLTLAVEENPDYTLVGLADIFGTEWDKDNTDNDMVKGENDEYSKTYYNVALTAGYTIKYKVVKNHDWTANWGMPNNQDQNAEYWVENAGNYDITFYFNPTTPYAENIYVACDVTAVPSTVTKSISSAGYATYCSHYALDFTGTGMTAYIAKAGESLDVEFEEVTTIPANTGVLLKGNAGEYNIPVIASADEVIGNLFEGVTEATAKDAGIFVLMASPEVGFYKTTKTFTVGANTAYIPADVVTSTRSFIAIDDDNTTSISNVNVNLNDNMVYNLRGQRVAQPTKGLYIVNGKKVVIK